MSKMFYRIVVQVVFLFGVDTWVLSEAMSRNLEGVHVGFLRYITGKKEKRQRDGTWRSEAAEMVLKEVGTQILRAYIEKWQAKVEEWVALMPILEICDRDTG